jgi:hypothetical protein
MKHLFGCFCAVVITCLILTCQTKCCLLRWLSYSLSLSDEHAVAPRRTICCAAQSDGAGIGGAVDGAVLKMVLEAVGCKGFPDEDKWLVYKTDLIGGR